MKKYIITVFLFTMMLLSINSAMACDKTCDCGCNKAQECTCIKDEKGNCFKEDIINLSKCSSGCRKKSCKSDCSCGCNEEKLSACPLKKSKSFFQKFKKLLFWKNKTECNQDY